MRAFPRGVREGTLSRAEPDGTVSGTLAMRSTGHRRAGGGMDARADGWSAGPATTIVAAAVAVASLWLREQVVAR
jgi:hypothetical protein